MVGENRCNDTYFRPLSGYYQTSKNGVNEIEILPKRGFLPVLEKTQLTGHIKKEHEIIILDLCNFDLKISEIQKYFLVFADF